MLYDSYIICFHSSFFVNNRLFEWSIYSDVYRFRFVHLFIYLTWLNCLVEWIRKKQWLSCWNEENMIKRKRVIAWSNPTHPWEFIDGIHFQGKPSTKTYPHVFWRQESVFEFELLEPKSATLATSNHLPIV